jgi:hypothetical protein
MEALKRFQNAKIVESTGADEEYSPNRNAALVADSCTSIRTAFSGRLTVGFTLC